MGEAHAAQGYGCDDRPVSQPDLPRAGVAATGVLVLAGTPIGRPEDASPRLARELAEADVVAAEDTRRLRRLTSDLGVELTGRVVSYFEGNEHLRPRRLVDALLAGERVVVLVTDAGMPSVSDPGYPPGRGPRSSRACASPACRGRPAVLTALAVSGLPSTAASASRGFLPRKGGERSRRLASVARERSARWSSSRRPTARPRRSPRWPRPSVRSAARWSAAS